jgi:hypothetical protein
MCATYGRATRCAVLAFLMAGHTSGVQAQATDEEVIADPELAGSRGTSASSADGEETIADPELAGGKTSRRGDGGWGSEAASSFGHGAAEAESSSGSEDSGYDPMANTGLAKIEVNGQQGVDLHRENYLEDFFESRLRFGAETDFRISRKLRLSTGLRLDFFYAAPHPNDTDIAAYNKRIEAQNRQRIDDARMNPSGPVYGEQTRTALDYDRYELDIVPLSAYLDATLSDGVHLRIGVQPMSLGRMDFFSPTDMLAVYDTRPSPKSDPSSMKLAQAALKLDWDLSTWATLQLAYVPWFMPHVSRSNQDRWVGAASSGVAAARQENPYGWLLSPSQQPMFSQSTMRYLGPAPDFTHPQAEARLNMRGSSFEVALLGGTALEKMPFIYYSPLVAEYLATAPPPGTDTLNDKSDAVKAYNKTTIALAQELAENRPVVDVTYPRYYLAGLDGSFDIAPLTIGFELAYSPSRMLYTASTDGSMPPLPNVSHEIINVDDDAAKRHDYTNSARDPHIRRGVPVAQAALHVEWIADEEFALIAEAFIIQALQMPYDKSREWLGFIHNTGTFAGGLLGGSYTLVKNRLTFMGSAALLPGISIIAMPQLELRLGDGLFANLGVQIYEGPTPGNMSLAPRQPFPTNLTAGGVFSGYDQVTLGFRWLPGS